MAWKFAASGNYAEALSQNWVNGATTLSFGCWGRMESVKSPAGKQYMMNLYGGSGSIGVRFETDGYIKATCYTNGTYRTVTGPAWAVSTTYHIVCTWTAGIANGFKLYVDNVLYQYTTSSQVSIDFGETNLWLGCSKYNSDFGLCSVEDVFVVRDYILSADEISDLYYGVPLQALPAVAEDYALWPLHGVLLTEGVDQGESARDLDTISGATDGGILATLKECPEIFDCACTDPPTTVEGPPEPPDWTEWPDPVDHPGHELLMTDLTPGQTYEAYVIAEDGSGNQSAPSAIVSFTAPEFEAHTRRDVILFLRSTFSIPLEPYVLPNRLCMVGFEANDVKEVYSAQGTAYSIVASPSWFRGSSEYSGRVNATGTAYGYWRTARRLAPFLWSQINLNTVYTKFHMGATSFPGALSEYIYVAEASTNALIFGIRVTSDKKLQIWNSSGQIGSDGSTVLEVETPYSIQVSATIGTSGTYEVLIDGVVEFSGTANLGTLPICYQSIGKWGNVNGQSLDIYWDDFASDIDHYPNRNLRIKRLFPISNGYYTGWTADSGLPENRWNRINHAPGAEGSGYLTCSVASEKYSAKLESCSTKGIFGYIGACEVYGDLKYVSESSDTQVGCRFDGTDLLCTLIAGGNQYYSEALICNQAPGSIPWSTDILNALEAVIGNGLTTRERRCQTLQVMVEWWPI